MDKAADIKVRFAREMADKALEAMADGIRSYRAGLGYEPRRIEREQLQELIDGLDKLRDVVQDCVRALPEADDEGDERAEAAE